LKSLVEVHLPLLFLEISAKLFGRGTITSKKQDYTLHRRILKQMSINKLFRNLGLNTMIRYFAQHHFYWIVTALSCLGLLCLGIQVVSASAQMGTRDRRTNINKAASTCPSSMNFGETIQCSIDTAGEIDSFTFSANAGDIVLARASKAPLGIWPGVRVNNSVGTTLCEQVSTDSQTAEIASCTLPSAGTYTIQVYEHWYTSTGGYYLYLQRLNDPGDVTPITFGQTLAASLSTPAEMDTYTFAATAGDKVLVRAAESSSFIWPGVRVYAPDGAKLCEKDSEDSESAEVDECSLPSTGTYTILAYDSEGGTYTGGYYLYLQRLNNPGNFTSIAFGQTSAGSITTPAQMGTFTFTATAGDKVLVRASRPTGSLWPGVRIYGPDGTRLCIKDSTDSVSAEIGSCSLFSTGTHTILVYDKENGTHTGSYGLYLQRLNNPGNTISIDHGQMLTGTISTAAEMDSFTFSSPAGDRVMVKMKKTSGSLWPVVRIYDPSGTKLCEKKSPDAVTAMISSCSLPSTGMYLILAFDDWYGTHAGNYRLYLDFCKVHLPLIVR
jgi:hypothetical protein